MCVSHSSMWDTAYQELTPPIHFNTPWPLCRHNTEEHAWSITEYLPSAISNQPKYTQNEEERDLWFKVCSFSFGVFHFLKLISDAYKAEQKTWLHLRNFREGLVLDAPETGRSSYFKLKKHAGNLWEKIKTIIKFTIWYLHFSSMAPK